MDLSAYKSLKINGVELVKLVINGVVAWAKKTYTNLVPLSTDSDGSIYNGVGYKDGVRLSSSGGVSSSAQPAGTTTGFIPWGGDADILRLKGVEWLNASDNHGGHYYLNFYNQSKAFLAYESSLEQPAHGHILTATRDANGVEMFVWNQDYGTNSTLLQAVRNAKYIRITAYGKGADMIVTINEEI